MGDTDYTFLALQQAYLVPCPFVFVVLQLSNIDLEARDWIIWVESEAVWDLGFTLMLIARHFKLALVQKEK